MRISDTARVALILSLGVLVGVWGCGGGSKNETSTAEDTTATAAPKDTTTRGRIEAMLNETIDRTRYKDPSSLWENKLEYLHDRETYDDYVKRGQIPWAISIADTTMHIDVDSVTTYDHDSALVIVTAHFKGYTGKVSQLSMPLTVYYQDGRWIKPTVSVIEQQVSFDSIRNEAIKAAEREAGKG